MTFHLGMMVLGLLRKYYVIQSMYAHCFVISSMPMIEFEFD